MASLFDLFDAARDFLLASCLTALTVGAALKPLVRARRQTRRILYVQFTNPGNYPPLQHSAHILADAGWEVRMLGTESFGPSRFLRFPSHRRIRVTTFPFLPGGYLQKLQYVWFSICVIWTTMWWRASWIYASELLSYFPAYIASLLTGKRVILHEHDLPVQQNGPFQSLLFFARKRLAQRAAAVVVPNHARAEAFQRQTGSGPVSVVWNCPSLTEAAKSNYAAHGGFILYYHGNVSPQLIPLTVLEALRLLPDDVTLRIVGYEIPDSVGYIRQIQETAAGLGIARRVDTRPAVPRSELLEHSRSADVGLALFPIATDASTSFAGASNKVFDYLCCGLPVLVTDCAEWNAFLAGEGCSLTCNPADPASIGAAVLRLYHDRDLAQKMGRRGRNRILSGWNYETQFAPVLEILQSEPR